MILYKVIKTALRCIEVHVHSRPPLTANDHVTMATVMKTHS
jgi:hypothetical protein